MALSAWRIFTLGLALGLMLAASFIRIPSATAGHLQTGCYGIGWTEAVRENDSANESGGHAQIKISYPDGGPVNNGGIVKTIFVWQNFDNWAEVGWAWVDNVHIDPTRVWAQTDAGTYKDDKFEGDAGAKGTFHHYKLNNDSGKHWKFRADGTTIHGKTFVNLDDGFPWGNSEVDNSCDSAWAHFKDLTERDCETCSWDRWNETQNWSVGTENPCYHTELVSNKEFYVRHGSGSGETCA